MIGEKEDFMADTSLQFLGGGETLIKILTGGAIGALITWITGWLRERRSVNVALEAEIDRTCEAITKQLEFIRGKKGTTIQPHAIGVTWLPFKTPVWDGLVDKLGVLGSRRARETASLDFLDSLMTF
jgi:hypothetical protein